MKRIINQILLLSFLAVAFASCKKDENQIKFEGGTNPVLTANRTTTIPLSFLNQDNEAIKLTWTNPDYKFTTGISSQDVSYLVEIDTVGANFTNPQKQTVAVSKDLSLSITVKQLNDYLLNQLQLDSLSDHQLEIRVRSSLFNNTVPLYSNSLVFTARPYAIPPKVNPPSTNKLFITGSATPASWQCGCGEPELLSQQFTRVNNTLYELTIALNGNASYLLLPRYGTWSAFPPDPEKYGYTGGNNLNNPLGDDFKAFGGDFKAPAESGTYKITVDFQRGKTSLVKL